MTLVKICGVTLPDDAAAIAAAGADFIGLNFWPESKRYLAPDRAPMLADIARAAGEPKLVGVFVDPTVDDVLAICARVALDVIQLHGDESADFARGLAAAVSRPIWKAIAVHSARDLEQLDVWPVDAIVLDTPGARVRHARPDTDTELASGRGGSGVAFDHALARRASGKPIVLAGGLRPETVGAAIAAARPYAVDVASGVEVGPGVKDHRKVAAFIAAARGAS